MAGMSKLLYKGSCGCSTPEMDTFLQLVRVFRQLIGQTNMNTFYKLFSTRMHECEWFVLFISLYWGCALNEHFQNTNINWQLLHQRKVTCPTCITLNPYHLLVYFANYQMASVVPLQSSGHADLWRRECGWAWPPWCCPPEGWWRTTMGCWGHSSARAEGRRRWNAV